MNYSQKIKIFFDHKEEPLITYISEVDNIDRKGKYWIFFMKDRNIYTNVRLFVFLNEI